MKHRRVDVVDVHRVLNGLEAEVVRHDIRHAALDAAGKLHAEPVGLVVAAVIDSRAGTGLYHARAP